jgi:protein arginine kinase activator
MDERPIECSGCKKCANVLYRKIKNGEIETTRMCQSCPILQSNIGSSEEVARDDEIIENIPNCPNCMTSIDEIKTSSGLGCPDCYKHFEDYLVKELLLNNSIPMNLNSNVAKSKSAPIHLGASPTILKREDSTKRLQSLQAALKEAVISESFERAAILRDEIKNLMVKIQKKESKT